MLKIALQCLGELDKTQLCLEHVLERVELVQREKHLEKRIRRSKPRPLQPRNRRHRNARTPRKIGLRPFLALPRQTNKLAQTRQHIFHRS